MARAASLLLALPWLHDSGTGRFEYPVLLLLATLGMGVMLSATVLQVIALGWYNLRLLTGAARQAERVVHDVKWRA